MPLDVEITASVHDFQRRRTNYFDTIRDLLRHILYYDTGLALLNELDATNKVLYIRPYRIHRGDDLNAETFPIGQDGEVGTLEAWLSVILRAPRQPRLWQLRTGFSDDKTTDEVVINVGLTGSSEPSYQVWIISANVGIYSTFGRKCSRALSIGASVDHIGYCPPAIDR